MIEPYIFISTINNVARAIYYECMWEYQMYDRTTCMNFKTEVILAWRNVLTISILHKLQQRWDIHSNKVYSKSNFKTLFFKKTIFLLEVLCTFMYVLFRD